MEIHNKNIGSMESIKGLSKGNYDAFELCAKIANTKDSDLSLKIIEYFNAPPAILLDLYKLGSGSDVEKFSEILKFYSSVPRSDLDVLKVLSTDENGLSAKALLLVTGLSISSAIEYGRPISYVIGDLAATIVEEGLKGEKIYKEYEDAFVTAIYQIILANLGSGTNPYGDLEKLGIPENMLSTTCELAKLYNENFDPSRLMRK
ncbi:hypothetical protein Micr_00751 [Candidatus Micrarchaeum sp.]|jgi:hypothetical protein|nr:MAG: hypothetical protein JJ59_01400 [Candidatus Micrarchaeum sp. AZ1]OWP53725.1 MAG: hypothetical protein B2I19_02135 [Thermoplasmatales archaeon ARMAN]QRF74217.1 hypothetical protein Micr_00751 [Candidatus Micrarchaeum sp.]